MKLLGVSGSLIGSRTSTAVYDVLVAAKAYDPEIEIELIDLKNYNVEFVKGFPLANYNDDTRKVVNSIMSADSFVIGSPIYQASISGVLKNLFDHLPKDAFKSKVTGILTTGGSDRHYLVSEYHLKPILSFFKGIVPVTNVFVHDKNYDKNDKIVDQDVIERIQKLAKEIVNLQKSISNT